MEPWVSLRYVNDIFFICTQIENKVQAFLQRFQTSQWNLKLMNKNSKTSVNFLDVVVRINGDKFETDLYS